MAILACREGLSFTSPIISDSAPLNSLVSTLLETVPGAVHCLRDPTRGGVATALNEIAMNSNVTAVIEDDCLPFTPSVKSASEMLGLDPLYAANEGKVLVFASGDKAPQILKAMRGHYLGKEAKVIGSVIERGVAPVFIKTRVGGTRILPMLTGEQLPRIC
jgi:hydrogenase expression/formation protein HypE